MWETKLISVLCTLVLFACLAGVQAQGISQSASNVANAGTSSIVNQQTSQVAVSQYSDYYTVPSSPSASTGSKAKTHIEPLKKYDIKNRIPTTVYFDYQMQAVPYTQYQTYSTYTGGNSLWIQGATSWAEYAQVPQGSSLSLLATSSAGGNGYLYEINPNGILSQNSFYYFPAGNQIGFYADTIGQHILLFIIGGQVSNAIVIDVVAYYQPPSYPTYQQPSYPSPIYYNPYQGPSQAQQTTTSQVTTVVTGPSTPVVTSPPLTSSNQAPRIISFTADAANPQNVGTRIRWTTETQDPEGDTLFFRYLVKGPQTNGQWKDYSAWIPDKYWSWLTSMFEPGQYQIQVQVRDKYHAGENSYDDERIADFTLLNDGTTGGKVMPSIIGGRVGLGPAPTITVPDLVGKKIGTK